MVKAICIIAVLLISQFGVYWYRHKNDGGGQDGEMGDAIISLGGLVLGIVLLAGIGLSQLF